MELLAIPFGWRLAILAGLLAAAAGVELRLRGRRAERWREYLFLSAAGLAGGVVGATNDLVTSSISPEYFALLKGIPAGGGFTEGVVALGFQAGFTAGAIGAGLLLIANRPRPARPALACRRLVRPALRAGAAAVLAGILLGAAACLLPGVEPWGAEAAGLSPPAARRLEIAASIHLGLYAGLLGGVIWGVLSIRRARRAAPAGETPPAQRGPGTSGEQPPADPGPSR
jgi:hypothetical protein